MQVKQTCLVIMGAGRCGSSALISYLNRHSEFLIYGENHAALFTTLQAIQNLDAIEQYSAGRVKTSELDYSSNAYIGTEWYNEPKALEELRLGLKSCIRNFFGSIRKFVGFKEIRWFGDLRCLCILQELFEVRYVFLKRDDNEQALSMLKLRWYSNLQEALKRIQETNGNISSFLEQQDPDHQITLNISEHPQFVVRVLRFLKTGSNP